MEGNNKDQGGNQQNRDSKNDRKKSIKQKLVLWKGKQNWKTWPESPKRGEKNSNKIRNEEEISMYISEIKKKKRIVWTIISQQCDNLEEMENFLEV